MMNQTTPSGMTDDSRGWPNPMKTLWILAAIAVAIAVLSFVLRDKGEEPAQPEGAVGQFEVGSVETVRGTVVRNDTSQVPADGPGFLVVRTDDDREVEVVYSCGMLPVTNTEGYNAGASAQAGARVEASGAATSERAISICESNDYYIRLEGGSQPVSARVTPEYYDNLVLDCTNAAGEVNACCRQSVDAMKEGGYTMALEQDTCPSGYKTNKLQCAGSLVWCEPEISAS